MSESGGDGAEGAGTDAPGSRDIWIEKYRPESLDDVVGHPDVVERLQSYVERDDLPNLLFSGPAGVGKCVTGETPVLTNRGVERIEDVVGEVDGFGAPDDDLSVLSFGADGGFEYAEPSRVFSKRAENLRRVETRDGNTTTVTPEHRLLAVGESGLDWRTAADLQPGDRIARPLAAPTPDTDPSIDWVDALDGDRVFVTVSETFARRHGIPAEADHVGTKRHAVALREGHSVEDIAADLDGPRKTVEAYRRQVADTDLQAPAPTCSLSTLRDLDTSRDDLREHVESIRYVTSSNGQSPAVDPPWTVTPDLAEFVGLAVAEARIDGGRVKFYNTDDDLLDRFARLARTLFGLDPTRGRQQDVRYVEVDSKTLTHYLARCFDVVAGVTDGNGIGSTLVTAPTEARTAFLRAVFDAEAHVTATDTTGTVELTQKNPRVVTLLSYLLASVGVPSRRSVERKAATNGTGVEREYHTLRVSGASHLARFEATVGFTLAEKAARLAEHAAGDSNPNHDTVPVQSALDNLCADLHLTKSDLLASASDSPVRDREAHLDDVDRVVDAAVDRIETAQRVQREVADLRRSVARLAAVPARWVDERDRLEPLERRRAIEAETGVRSDHLLEYADGRRAPTARRTERRLAELGVADVPDAETVQRRLRDAVESLGVPYERVADGTELSGTEVIHLLENDDHDLSSLPHFETVAERIVAAASGMLTEAVLERLTELDRLAAGELYFDEVRSVTAVEESRRVYDLTVPERRNYVAGQVPTVMHNTTSAVAIARTVYGDDWRDNFLELNASDDRGIDVVRGRIKDFARTSFGGYDYRIVFLDEADSLCLPPGTGVVTGSPSKPEVKPIEEVAEEGEPVPSVDFETNEVQSDTGSLVDSGVADFFEMELADGREITASPTHPFFVVGDDGELVERELCDLEPGDEIADFRDELGLSRCEICDEWTAGRFCSLDCKTEGHSRAMRGAENPMHAVTWSDERREKFVEKLSDGGRREVSTVEVRRVGYSHRGKAYNVTMDGTPNFALANGILTHNTDDAQSALRRTMEQFSNNTRFVLSCNYSSQIIDPIQSRCAVFRFAPLSDDAVADYVRTVADAEGIEVTDDAVDALTYVADGDMRRALNALQAAAVTGDAVDEAAVYAITATARPEEIEAMVTQALDGEFVAARGTLDELLTDRGIAGGDVVDQVHRSVWDYDLSDEAAVRVLDRLGEADYRIAEGGNERIQLESLLAAIARESRETDD